MRKYVVLASLVSAAYATPVFSHAVQPETKFFQEQLLKDPMTGSILDYCNLAGINEVVCRAEFYPNDMISATRLEAAKKCVEASGREYRASFDAFFKSDGSKNALVAHAEEKIGLRYHEGYLVDPKTGEKHRHQWSRLDREDAGDQAGRAAVKYYKENYADITKSGTVGSIVSGEFKGSTDAVVASSEVKVATEINGEMTETKKGPSPEEIKQVYMGAYARGYAHPDRTEIIPSIYCPEGKPCITPNGDISNEDSKFKDAKEVTITKPVDVPAPKSETIPVKPIEEKKTEIEKESAEELTQPIPTSTSTGGFDTDSNTEDGETETPEEKLDGITTPVDSPTFVQELNDCINRAEHLIFKVMGSKTYDPDAQTAEEKKAEAEEKLKAGNCDESFYGTEFCQDFKNKQASHEAQGAEEKAKAAKDQALENFQKYGICDPILLGIQFCQNAKALQDMDKDNPAEESVDGHVSDGNTIPETNTDPEGTGDFSIGDPTPNPLKPNTSDDPDTGSGRRPLLVPGSIHP